MACQFARKPLAWYKRAHNIRKTTRSEEARHEMAESLKVRQLHPLLARSDGTLIDGYLRLDSAEHGGITHLDTVITDEDLAPDQITEYQFISVVFREDVSAHDKWLALEAIKKAHPQWQAKDLAAHLKIDPSMVTRLLCPGRCIPAAQEALRDGTIGIKSCYEISKVEPALQPALLARALGGSADDVAKESRKQRNGSTPAPRSSRIRIELTSGTTVTIAGDDLSLEDGIREITDVLAEMRKAEKQGLDCKTFAAVMRDRARAGV